MKTIGITGGIASGKSLVSNILVNQGYTVIDCDRIAHEVITYSYVIKQIVSAFGQEILKDQQIDRKALGEIIFHDHSKQPIINNIIHPQVIKEVKHQLKVHRKEEIVFVDVPLLYEANMEDLMDKVIVVYTKPEIQLLRLIKRDNISEEYAFKKINSQMSMDEKAKRADFVINNSDEVVTTKEQLNNIIRRIKDEI